MIIVLDTNIIQGDFLLKSGKTVVLLDYVSKTQSKFVMPKIVYDELMANYERGLISRKSKFLDAQ